MLEYGFKIKFKGLKRGLEGEIKRLEYQTILK